MGLTGSILSNDYFFIVGIISLLTSEWIDENQYYIVDVEATNFKQIKEIFSSGRTIVVFVNNDLDYYALRDLCNIIIIDKRCRLKNIISCLLINDSQFTYQVKYTLSLRESEVLSCIQEGLDADETGKRLNISTKTFYAHRRSLVLKFQLDNRISLYQNIIRVEAYKQKCRT